MNVHICNDTGLKAGVITYILTILGIVALPKAYKFS